MPTRPCVTTRSGEVRGSTVVAPSGRSVQRFLGVPYAEAPTGDLRWRPPVAPTPWAGTRDATSFAPAAPQAGAIETVLPGFSPDVPTGEDCLALNVWTPALDGRRPVLVWLPGGAYLSGGTAQPVYDATRLADEGDLVVVSVGYRLGALGFLAPEGDGVANCGLRDQLAALAWVREHAAELGGDRHRVTLMGESAGAGSVLHLLASRARGNAFDRAIAQSGQPTTLEAGAAAEIAAFFADAAGVADDVAALRGLPLDRLLDAQQRTTVAMLGSVGPMAFAPSIDDDVCDGTIRDGIAAGRAADVSLALGTTRDELALFPDPRAAALDEDRLLRWIARLHPVIDAEGVRARYREELGGSATDVAVWDAARTDAMMRAPNLEVADAHAHGSGAGTHVYRFDWEARGLGAAHAVDVPFTFGTFDREGWGDVIGYDDRAEALGVAWRRAWAELAWGRAPWAPYDETRPTMVFTREGPRLLHDPSQRTRECWMAPKAGREIGPTDRGVAADQ